MDMVAAIQAAKSQLEAETSKKQAKQNVVSMATNNNSAISAGAGSASAGDTSNQGGSRHQKSNSFQFGTSDSYFDKQQQQRPPTNIVSFKGSSTRGGQPPQSQLQQGLQQLNRLKPSAVTNTPTSSSSLPPLHGDYISSEYQYGVNKYSTDNYNQNDMDNDNYSITSSLSGTLPDLGVARLPPPPPPPPPPALTRDHLLAGLNLLPLTNNSSHPPTTASTSTTTTQTKTNLTAGVGSLSPINNTNHSTSTTTTSPTTSATASNNFGVSSTSINSIKSLPMNNISNNTTTTNHNNSNNNNMINTDDLKNNKDNSTNGTSGNSNTKPSTSSTSDDPAKRRIEEIMSEYQGRVDTILRRQRSDSHGDIITSNINSTTTTTTSAGVAAFTTTSASGVISAASAPVEGDGGNSSVDGTKTNPRLESSTVNVDDILSTYKKRVGEIMSKASPSPDKITASKAIMMNPQLQLLPLPITLAVDNVILDDETSDYDRESAVDGAVSVGGGGGLAGGAADEDDYSEEEDDSDHDNADHVYGESSQRSPLRTSTSAPLNVMNSVNINTINTANRSGSMSERANAVLQSLHSSGEGGEREGGEEVDGMVGDAHSENSSGGNTHISGASSASELSARNERGESSHGYNLNRDQPQKDDVDDPREVPIRRKDSLLRAQELTASTTFDKANRRHSIPKNFLQDEPARIDLEKRLAEALQREEELSRENIRLEKNLKDARAELDKVQSEARSTKYSSSEQASRIKELERKLKNEKERYEELERERDAMKDEYEQDLEDQKDINRQLEQMVMSEEFEKELEDEINQVKELEHANRRFKVKIDMLERERNTIAKKYETKIEDYTIKITSLEEQLAEWERRAGSLENNVRNTAEEWEVKLADEKRNSRDLQFDLEKAQTKLKGMEAELIEMRESSSKIDEYEQVLGKLMERNEELEGLAKSAKDELEMAHRQEQVSDRRRAVKMKDLEEMIEEQRITIEQQQETLDESVKTILKLYSLNNENAGDLSVLTEEKLTDMARAMVPPLGSHRTTVPRRKEEDRVDISGYTSLRPSVTARSSTMPSGINANRSREVVKELDNSFHGKSRARSRGRTSYSRLTGLDESDRQFDGKVQSQPRPRHHTATPEDLGINNKNVVPSTSSGAIARHSSRGRGGERTESIRQLTERALTPARDRDRNRSPTASRPISRHRSTAESYDPTGPMSDSLALVPVATTEYSYGGQYDIPPPRSRSVGRREITDDRDRNAIHDYSEVISYNPRLQAYDKHHSSSTVRSNRTHQYNSHNPGNRRDRDRDRGRVDSHQQADRERDRRERDKGDQRMIERNRDRERDSRGADKNRGLGGGNDPYYQGTSAERGGGYPNPNRSARDRSSARDRDSRSNHRSSNGDGYGEPKVDAYSYSRRSTRDRSPTGETYFSEDDGARAWRGNGGKHHSGGKSGGRSRRDP